MSSPAKIPPDAVRVALSDSASRSEKPLSRVSSRSALAALGVDASPTVARSLMICAFYGMTSVSITFFNKAIFSVYHFRFPCLVTLLQILVCICSLSMARIFGNLKLPDINMQLSRQVFPLAFIWWLYVVTGIAALRYLTIPMFSTLRKSTALIVLILETTLLRKQAKPSIWLAILVMVSGGFIAGVTDLSFSAMGYTLVGICCVATALYLVLIVRVSNTSKLGTFALLYYNNMLALPLMLTYLLLFTNELQQVTSYPYLYDIQFWMFFVLSAAQATLLNIAIFLCTKLNSPLATTVTGQMKDFVTVGFGFFVFGDVKVSIPNLTGLFISMFGSALYSLIKLLAATSKPNEDTSLPASTTTSSS